MTDGKTQKNGNGTAAEATPAGPQLQVQIVGQYIKDMSFENPNVDKLIGGPGDSPNIQLEINVDGRTADAKNGLYESALNFRAQATSTIGTIYELEIIYAGMFKIQNIPEQALEPFLIVNCPTLLFPFLRRLIADLTREGGFPPLLLDPIDFGALYMRKQQELKAASAKV